MKMGYSVVKKRPPHDPEFGCDCESCCEYWEHELEQESLPDGETEEFDDEYENEMKDLI